MEQEKWTDAEKAIFELAKDLFVRAIYDDPSFQIAQQVNDGERVQELASQALQQSWNTAASFVQYGMEVGHLPAPRGAGEEKASSLPVEE